MPPVITEKSLEINGRTLTIEHGRIAGLADGAVTVRYGDTVVLATAVGAKEPRPGIDFLPLTVDYEEKMYAAGKIPGGFIKREGRPSEKAILTARLTDRPIRPLFPDGWRSEIQLITTVLSADQQNDPDVLSIVGASAALTISDIPWDGPIAAVRVGDVDGNLVVNPTSADLEQSRLNMVVAGTADAVMMVEGEAEEIPEERMIEAVMTGHDEIKRIVELLNELREAVGKPKREFTPPEKNTELIEKVENFVADKLRSALFHSDKEQRIESTSALKAEAIEALTTPNPETMSNEEIAALPSESEVSNVFQSLVKGMVRREILESGERPDGRKPDEIREIWGEVSYLPRTHGSAIFTRGQTQVVTIATLGTSGEGQMIDGIGLEESKRYMHHYNFPPYSVGEARFMRGPSRRDIGHGALAERALVPVLPEEDEFPYTLRLVSEVVTSNGSTSMASVCGSTMALMDAGVPIKAPVAGMAMGLITEDGDRYQILSDIQGVEDALGDMDFKVAGTGEGVTAIQMDIKVAGITAEIMREALEQARKGRLFILSKMHEVIDVPRGDVSAYAPQITRIQIDKQQIGTLIGPGGKTIRGIQEETGAKLEVEEDGTVYVSSVDRASSEAAIARVEALTKVPEVGEVYTGKVKTIIASGAFVEILPGKDGFVHISELENRRVEKVEDVLEVGDEVTVVVSAIRNDGKINLSRKRLLSPDGGEDEGGSSGSGGGNRGGSERRGGGGDRDRNRDRDRQQARSGDRGGNRGPQRQERESQSGSGEGEQIMRRPRDSRTPPGRS